MSNFSRVPDAYPHAALHENNNYGQLTANVNRVSETVAKEDKRMKDHLPRVWRKLVKYRKKREADGFPVPEIKLEKNSSLLFCGRHPDDPARKVLRRFWDIPGNLPEKKLLDPKHYDPKHQGRSAANLALDVQFDLRKKFPTMLPRGRRNSDVSVYEQAQENHPCHAVEAYVKSRMAVPMHKRYEEPASTLQELGWGEEREVRPKPLVMASNGLLQRDSLEK